MKALVTGAGGFLGRYLVEALLADGSEVRTFGRGEYPFLQRPGVENIRGDIRDQQATVAACQGVDVVYHAAALAGIWGPWDDFYSINVQGTRHVLQGCQEHGVPKLVYTSSPSVTFSCEPQEGIDESTPYSETWLCYYPQTKALAEQEVLAANRQELLTCALRPHLIWGPGDQHLIPRLISRARSGRLRRVGDGQNLIDMIYVENAAAAHLQAAAALSADSPVAGQAYFLSQGDPVNCWDWINEILALAEIPPIKKSISFRAAWNVGATLERMFGLLRISREPPMTRFLAAQLSHAHYFDIRRARRDFGYSPGVSTDQGMQRLQAWLREQPSPGHV